MSLLTVLLPVTILYAAFIGWCGWRVRRPQVVAPALADADLPEAAVLVAARDEEAVIERCVRALLAQDYPADRLTVVVADDHSTDRTAEIVRRLQAEHAGALALAGDGPAPEEGPSVPRLLYVRVPDPEGTLRGKAQAIHTATLQTDASVLLITDADCAPPPSWARRHAETLALDDVGLTAGLTAVAAPRDQIASHVQDLDWSFLLGAASALTEAGIPATAMGNNMALRREAYEAVGGYPALPFSVTEDYALFKAVVDQTPWRARFPLDPATTAITLPTDTVAHAYVQRRRWARGGMRAGPALYAVYLLAHLSHLLPLIGLALAPLWGLGALAIKMGVDAWYIQAARYSAVGPHDPARGPLRFFAFEAFLFAYMTTLPLAILLRPRIRWKGRVH